MNTCKRNSRIFEYYKQKISNFLQIINLVKNLFPVNPRKSLIKLVQTFPFVLRKKIVEFLSEILFSLESSLNRKFPAREEPSRICRMRRPRFMKPRVQSATVFTVTKGRACKLNTIPWTGTLFHDEGSPFPLRWIINFVQVLFFPPSTDFPDQLSMKKRVSSPVVAPAGFSKILDFGASTTEEAMNSVTGQQTADPTNAPSSFSSSSSSLFLGLSTKLLLSVLYGCFSSLAGISPLATSSSRRRGGRRGGGEVCAHARATPPFRNTPS